MDISGKTKITGLFGYPVEHSLSPAMHNIAFRHLNLDYCYVAFPVKPEYLEDAVKAIRALDLAGVNVTIPHKEKVINFLDEISDEAMSIGAVNTIKNDKGRLIGFNTDGRGFMESLSENSIVIKDKRVLIIGAGGASRAIGYYICKESSMVYLTDKDAKKAESLRDYLNFFRGNVYVIDNKDLFEKGLLDNIDIIINATPLGLKPEDALPIDVSFLKKDHIVCDLIYKETPFLKRASAIGCKTLDGLGMLLWQGVFAFEIWTGRRPPVDIMRDTLIRLRG